MNRLSALLLTIGVSMSTAYSNPGAAENREFLHDRKDGEITYKYEERQLSESELLRAQLKADTLDKIHEWDRRLALLKNREVRSPGHWHVGQTQREIEAMQDQAKKDLVELDKVSGKEWLDVKARLQARFQSMDRRYEQFIGE